MDLRRQPPRSVREKLAGYVHLARMLDKCRATLAGTAGEYIYPCPLDRRLLEFAGISGEEFSEAVRNRNDQDVGDWFQTRARHSRSEIEDWNERMLSLGPETEDKWAYFRSSREAVAPGRTDITTWADLLDLEEGRAVPRRANPVTGGR